MKLQNLYIELLEEYNMNEDIVPPSSKNTQQTDVTMTPIMKQIKQNTLLTFTPEKMVKEIVRLNIKHPDVVIAQAMLESGNFKSNLFQKNNNIFGMKYPRQRSTTAAGNRYGQSFYKNWYDSIKDYKLWQEARNLTSLSKDEYINKLNKIYCIPPSCGADNYALKVKQLLGKANELLSKSNAI